MRRFEFGDGDAGQPLSAIEIWSMGELLDDAAGEYSQGLDFPGAPQVDPDSLHPGPMPAVLVPPWKLDLSGL